MRTSVERVVSPRTRPWTMESSTTSLDDLPPYVYSPLPTASSIRILDLYPGEGDEPIRCKLRLSELGSESRSYIGLSYCWGDPTDPIPIECNGQKAFVARNLHSALRRIRDITSPATMWIDTLCISLWVDALCISQSREPDALRERERQVQMMGCIYAEARTIIVDLGERPKYFDELLNVFHAVVSVPLGRWNASYDKNEVPEDMRHLSLSNPFWFPFKTFVSRPWFKRVWVVQEFVLAKQVTMLVGHQEFDPEFINNVFDRLCKHCNLLLLTARVDELLIDLTASLTFTSIALDKICELRSEQGRGKSIEFCDLVFFGRAREATDPRDRAYGLLGLASDVNLTTFQANYSESIESLSTRVARFLVNSGHGARILASTDGMGHERPSWALNLGSPTDLLTSVNRPPAGILRYDGSSEASLACGSTKVDIHFEEDGGLLVATGGIVDGILNLSGISPPAILVPISSEKPSKALKSRRSEQMIQGLLEFSSWYVETLAWFSKLFGTFSDENVREIYWRTIIVNYDISKTTLVQDTEEYARMFEAFHAYFSRIARLVDEPWDASEAAYYGSLAKESVVFMQACRMACSFRRLCQTENGRAGLVPGQTIEGDRVCVFSGVPIPFVIRRKGDHYQLVGPCYVHDMMDGQAVESEDWHVEEIVLE